MTIIRILASIFCGESLQNKVMMLRNSPDQACILMLSGATKTNLLVSDLISKSPKITTNTDETAMLSNAEQFIQN